MDGYRSHGERDPSFLPLEPQIVYCWGTVPLRKIDTMFIVYTCVVMAVSFLKGTSLSLKARLWELGKICISIAVDDISSLPTNSL